MMTTWLPNLFLLVFFCNKYRFLKCSLQLLRLFCLVNLAFVVILMTAEVGCTSIHLLILNVIRKRGYVYILLSNCVRCVWKSCGKSSASFQKMDLPAMINLRPSHALLNPNFDGYKLSLEPIPIIKSVLNAAPRRVFTNDDQYTFLHAKLFSLHNHLFRDPWLEYSCYFLDDNWAIQNVRYDTASGQLSSIKSVHKLPKSNVGRGDYNPSLCFVSEKYCVFTDGCGTLKILDTGDRYRVNEWKATFSCPMLDDSIPFVIQDARWEIIEGVHQIQCLTLSIQRKNDESDDKFETVIDWFVIKKDAELSAWNKSHVRQLRGNTLPDYCVLEPKCNGLLLSADKRFQFSFDSENPIENIVKTEEKVAAEEDASKNEFIWTQSDEDVTVHFKISRETQKRDIKVVCDGKMLQVRHKNDVLLDAELFERIDGDLTTWNLVNSFLYL